MLSIFRIGFLKISRERIQKWVVDENLFLLDFAFKRPDFRIRKNVVQILKYSKNLNLSHIFEMGLRDPIYPVAEETINSIKNLGLFQLYQAEIKEVQLIWKNKKKESLLNWSKPSNSSTNLYLDKSQMIRLKKLKRDLAKPKGSMSIG